MNISKVLIGVLAFVLIIVIIFYIIISGIGDIFKNFFKNLVGIVEDKVEAGIVAVKKFFGISSVKEGMYVYSVTDDNVNALKEQLESNKINTDESGMTEVMIKKMLLTQAVTSSTQDSLCIAEVQKEEILKNTDYTDLNEFFKSCNKKKSKSDKIWPIQNYNYDLYYITDSFFYFQDEKNIMGNGADKFYLGIMGKINVVTETGDELSYVDRNNFELTKKEYLDLDDKKKSGSSQEKNLLNRYTLNESGQMVVYKIIENSKTYDYKFTNKNINQIHENGIEKDSVYNVEEVPLEISNSVDTSQYVVSVELLLNFLNLTGSPQYIDEFIDYAIEKSSVTIKAYLLQNEELTYSKTDYNIKDPFIFELYDIVDFIDAGSDNMKTYKSLIYDREYNGRPFLNSVINLQDFDNINYSNEDEQISVKNISDYLLSAYDPDENFELGNILVEQTITNRKFENIWTFSISSISTWYGDIVYGEVNKGTYYTIDSIDSSKTEYDNFTGDKLTEYKVSNEEEKTKIFIYEKRANEVDITDENNKNVTKVNSADIFDNILKQKIGEEREKIFDNWTIRGLGNISFVDNGKYSKQTGIGNGSDYLYSKYTKTNVKLYDSITKSLVQTVEENTNLPTCNVNKVYEFLALWKNKTGSIEDKTYQSDGEKVKYEDIYSGTTAVGDIFESGPEMLFSLLEMSDNTKGMVDIFKYIMYVYTGQDYGITDSTLISYIFATIPYGGSDYIVNTSLSAKELVLSEEQLKEAIEKTYKGKTKENLLSCINDFMYIQNEKKVNAVFAIAVAIQESSGGTNWAAIDESTYNWMSITGSYNGQTYKSKDASWRVYSSFNEATRDFGDLISVDGDYFKVGKYTVTSIALTYCNDKWGNSIISHMTKLYNSIGISGATGGTEAQEGNISTFTVGNRTYKNYKQIEEAYRNIQLANYPGSTLYSSGCAITSVAIIATGFGNNVTPVDVNNYYKTGGFGPDHKVGLSHYTGVKCSWIYSNVREGIISQLKDGFPVMVHVKSNRGTFSTSSGHFFTILSISEDGSKIYVSDPASRRTGVRTGWISISVLNDSCFDQYMRMEAK